MPSPFEIGSALIHLMTLLDEYTYTVGSSAVVATGVAVVSSSATAIVVVVSVKLPSFDEQNWINSTHNKNNGNK